MILIWSIGKIAEKDVVSRTFLDRVLMTRLSTNSLSDMSRSIFDYLAECYGRMLQEQQKRSLVDVGQSIGFFEESKE